MPIVTFAQIHRQILEDRDEGWRGLIQQFLVLTKRLVRRGFADIWNDESEAAAVFFRALRSNNADRLASFTGMSEKAFLIHLRDSLFAFGRGQRGESAPLGMTHEQFGDLLNEFPPVKRQAVVMLAKGWAPAEFSAILHLETGTAEQILHRANEKLTEMGAIARLPAQVGSGFDRLLQHLELQEAAEECIPALKLVRIVDGQIAWNEKEAAEKHAAECLHCLERLATYLEVHALHKECGQATREQTEAVERFMGLCPPEKEKQSKLLSRLFGAGKA